MRRILPFLLLFCPGLVGALTLSQLQTQVRRNIRDTSTDTSLQRYSDSTLTEYINEAQNEVVLMSWCISKSTSYVLSAGTTYYDLPSSYLGTFQVTFLDNDDNMRLLSQMSEIVQYQTNADFENNATGPPDHYFTRMAADGANKEIAYIPIPDTSSTGTVTVQYAYQPTALSGASDVPFDGLLTLYPYHSSIVARTSAIIKQIEGKTDEASVYFQVFDRYMAIMKDRNSSLPDYLPSARGATK